MGWVSHTPIERSMAGPKCLVVAAISTTEPPTSEISGKIMVQAKATSGKTGLLQAQYLVKLVHCKYNIQ